MPLFTKLFKLKSFSNKQFGRYLLYALGEIFLVVAGILIALQINNLNEERKNTAQLEGIYTTIANNLKNDTLMVSQVIANYEMREKILTKIINDSLDEEGYRNCAACASVISSYVPLTLSSKGFKLLNDFNSASKKTDTLAMELIFFNKTHASTIEILGEEIKDDALNTVKHWRDHYPWFSQSITRANKEAMIPYMLNDPDFKNRAAYYYIIACKNYLLYLNSFQENAKLMLEDIDERLSEE